MANENLPSSRIIDSLYNELVAALTRQLIVGHIDWDLGHIQRIDNMAHAIFQDEFDAARKREGELDYIHLIGLSAKYS